MQSPPQIAIVQWTHTLRMQNALLLARQQVKRAQAEQLNGGGGRGIVWGHHVLLQSCGAGRAKEESDCRGMRNTLEARGLTENVTCYTSVAMGESLPALGNIVNVFEHRGPHASNLTVGSYRWCWHSCDGAYLTFYAQQQHRLQHYDYFWFLEWDVVWTGSLLRVLEAWSVTAPATSTSDAAKLLRTSSAKFWTPIVEGTDISMKRAHEKYRGDESLLGELSRGRREHGAAPTATDASDRRATEDLICPNPAEVSRRWQHSPKRNYSLIPQMSTRMCVTEVTRMSRRLLAEVVAFALRKDAGMFCEMRAPTVCMRLPWCSVRTLFDPAHQPHLFANRTRWTLSWGIPTFGITSLRDSAGRTRADKDILYHAYKWPQKGFDPTPAPGAPALYDDLVGSASAAWCASAWDCESAASDDSKSSLQAAAAATAAAKAMYYKAQRTAAEAEARATTAEAAEVEQLLAREEKLRTELQRVRAQLEGRMVSI